MTRKLSYTNLLRKTLATVPVTGRTIEERRGARALRFYVHYIVESLAPVSLNPADKYVPDLGRDYCSWENWALNGADSWTQYSEGGSALCYDDEIAAKVLTTEVNKARYVLACERGEGSAYLLELQADWLDRAWSQIYAVIEDIYPDYFGDEFGDLYA